MGVGGGEHVARHHDQLFLGRGPLGERLARAPRSPREEIEGAPRSDELVVVTQARHQRVPLAAALGQRRVHRAVEGRDRSPLARLRGADKRVLLHHRDRIDDRLRAVDPAHPPAGHRVRLGKPVDHHHLLGVQGRGVEWRVVAVGAVELVADERHAPLLGEQCQVADRGSIGHESGRVGGRVEQDRPGGRRDRGCHAVDVDREGGRRVDRHHPATEKLDERPVHHERRLKDDHLVAGINQRHQREHQRPARPARHAELPLGLARLAAGLGLEPLAERRNALRGRVAVFPGVGRRLGRLPGSRRHREIGLPDREIDRVVEPRRKIEGLADARRVKRRRPPRHAPPRTPALLGWSQGGVRHASARVLEEFGEPLGQLRPPGVERDHLAVAANQDQLRDA